MKIKIGFFTVLLALTLLLDRSLLSLSAFAAAATHELGHIAMASLCGIRLQECRIGLYGAGIVPDGHLYSYGQEILLCLAGPLVNLFLGSIGLNLIGKYPSKWLTDFVFASLTLGLLNLLPIKDFDGGRILNALLCRLLSPRFAHRVLSLLSFFCIFCLWSLSVYLLLRSAASLSLFVFSISLFFRIFLSED